MAMSQRSPDSWDKVVQPIIKENDKTRSSEQHASMHQDLNEEIRTQLVGISA